DIKDSVISCEMLKLHGLTWFTALKVPYTKENKIMNLKLEYQTFRAKPSKSLSQTYTCYKTLLNELSNDGVNLTKHKINDFQENFDEEEDVRTSEKYLKDLDLDSQNEPKIKKDYKTEYKKIKGKLALLEASPSTSQSSKTFQSKNKCLVVKTFDWDEEEVSDDEDMTQVKALMALADDELSVGKNNARNGKWIGITMKNLQVASPSSEMLIDEKVNSSQKTREPKFDIPQTESSKSGDSSKRHIMEPIWYQDSGSSRSMTGVKSYLHKYIEKPGPKVVFGDISSCITKGYVSINRGGIIFSKVAFVNGLKYNLISISQLCDAKYIVQFDDKQGTIFNANKEIVLIAP
ncbi:hypothetical protein Tco_0557277, partial [Tanacetum coccineum]